MKIPFDPAKKERYKIPSSVERTNAHLKDSFLPKRLYVRGHEKVFFQLRFGRGSIGGRDIPSLADALYRVFELAQ